jgi:hypothetical protein
LADPLLDLDAANLLRHRFFCGAAARSDERAPVHIDALRVCSAAEFYRFRRLPSSRAKIKNIEN